MSTINDLVRENSALAKKVVENLEEARGERDRYRAALQRIADLQMAANSQPARIARAALGQTGAGSRSCDCPNPRALYPDHTHIES